MNFDHPFVQVGNRRVYETSDVFNVPYVSFCDISVFNFVQYLKKRRSFEVNGDIKARRDKLFQSPPVFGIDV